MPTYKYHWTTGAALPSVMATGLDPSFATGKRRVVWMAGRDRVLWGCDHAAMHQHCSPDQMVLVRVRTDGLRLGRTAWSGVVTSSAVIRPSRLTVMQLRVIPAPTKKRARRKQK